MRFAAIMVPACVVVALAAPAHAGQPVRLEVKAADAKHAWQQGRVAPFVVTITGIKATVRVDCFSPGASYVRAHNVRDGVPTPAVLDSPVHTLPASEQLTCTAYEGDQWVASWSGKLTWPTVTFPDHRISSLAAQRCGKQWCVDVALDRSHPGAVGATVEVLCTLRHASTDPFFVQHAPWSRQQVETLEARVQLKLGDAPGATVVACSVDRGLYGNARFADADATNNESTILVANSSPVKAQVELVSAATPAHVRPGCGNCSTPIPGSISVTTRVRNKGADAIAGAGVRCEAIGTKLELTGATGTIAAGATHDVIASIQQSSESMKKLIGPLRMRCDVVVWDQALARPASWTGTIEFPKP